MGEPAPGHGGSGSNRRSRDRRRGDRRSRDRRREDHKRMHHNYGLSIMVASRLRGGRLISADHDAVRSMDWHLVGAKAHADHKGLANDCRVVDSNFRMLCFSEIFVYISNFETFERENRSFGNKLEC